MEMEQKFKRQIFMNNVMRIKNVVMYFVDVATYIENLFEWESPIRSFLAFILYVVTVYYSEIYWAPIFLLLIFARNYLVISYLGRAKSRDELDNVSNLNLSDEDLDAEPAGDDDKKTFKEKLQAVQDVTAMVQNALGMLAKLAEGMKNTVNFSVPFLSWLAIVILVIVTVFLYYVNLRYLLIAWGIKKFSLKLIRPDFVPNNELLDFLSRVPDDEELKDFREMKLTEDKPQSPSHKSATPHHAHTDKKKKK